MKVNAFILINQVLFSIALSYIVWQINHFEVNALVYVLNEFRHCPPEKAKKQDYEYPDKIKKNPKEEAIHVWLERVR